MPISVLHVLLCGRILHCACVHMYVQSLSIYTHTYLCVCIHTYICLVCCVSSCLGVSIKMVQLLQHFEHLVMPTALMLEHFTTKFEVKAPAAEIVR